MAADEHPSSGFRAELPGWLDSDLPARHPARPDLPWVTGLVEYTHDDTGETRAVDLGRVTEAWLREQLDVRADHVLALLDRMRPHVSEAYFGGLLAGVASRLIYGD